ncbi:MAG: carbamoyltransferase HypF [Myxococcota bacterium]|nr:carbamoyltransferase HypF [Myxococcota bacterium]
MAEQIRVRGAVQGVGFRPTVARLAQERGLPGWVRNDAQGVLIALGGTQEQRQDFVDGLMSSLPPLARVDSVERQPTPGVELQGAFTIQPSLSGAPQTEVLPDAATCAACMAEARDPYQRRYRYPLTNCTHCGPRYSIQLDIPWDRPQTTMAGFALCQECGAEYADPQDRRYHAQPIACHACGPKARLLRTDGRPHADVALTMLDDMDAAGTLLMQGHIVAIKGLGGFHLCCLAEKEEVVARLRDRKQRPHKPFALMAPDLECIRRYCTVSESEATLLQSPANPIVLLRADGPESLPANIAPDSDTLGFMLPTTPLHRLMMLRTRHRPIVCTSGNRSEEPPCTDNDEAIERLRDITDWALVHDRPIANRVDDSVVRVMADAPRVLRRARGYAPASLQLPPGFEEAPPLLATGAQWKAALCLVQEGGRATLSPHIGDLDDLLAFEDYQGCLDRLSGLLSHKPQAVAVDLHEGYRSTQIGRGIARARALPLHAVQHHHAHIAACMAENGWPLAAGPVLGVALDGLGMGADGSLWGGEFLICSYEDYQRVGTVKPVALLGGDAAARQPWRNLYAHLRAEYGWPELKLNYGDTEPVQDLLRRPVSLLDAMLEGGKNAPLAHSTGRLFDAVAAAVGLHREAISYEAQAAVALEAAIHPQDLAAALAEPCYPISVPRLPDAGLPYLEPKGLWAALLGDVWAGTSVSLISARFHVALADAILRLVGHLRSKHPEVQAVALSGGVWQNKTLLELVAPRLGQDVLLHRRLPPHDGCVPLGQAAVAAARSLRTSPSSD